MEPSRRELNAGRQASQGQEAGFHRTGLNVDAPRFSSQNTTSLYVTTSKTVLLQTAQASVCNPRQPAIRLNVRVVLDTGSQRSYITQQAARALALKPEGTQRVSIFTFGSARRSSHDCELDKVMMETTDGEIELRLLTVPVICEPLATQPITLCVDSYEHLSELRLADSLDGSSPMDVDLLIESDYYWGLTTGRVSRGEGGSVAVETNLGWALLGPVPVAEQSLSLVTTHALRVDPFE